MTVIAADGSPKKRDAIAPSFSPSASIHSVGPPAG